MKSLSALLKYFKRYKTKMILGFLFIFISNISQIYIPIFLKDAIDSIKTNFEYSTLNTYALLIIAASIVTVLDFYKARLCC
jgi:ABC-type multidrug transport system fused ATPase/permease subunit